MLHSINHILSVLNKICAHLLYRNFIQIYFTLHFTICIYNLHSTFLHFTLIYIFHTNVHFCSFTFLYLDLLLYRNLYILFYTLQIYIPHVLHFTVTLIFILHFYTNVHFCKFIFLDLLYRDFIYFILHFTNLCSGFFTLYNYTNLPFTFLYKCVFL